MAFRPLVQLLLSFLLFSPFWYSANASTNGSFSIQLIHRDSPHSPLYSPSTTPFHRFTRDIRRSLARSSSLSSLSSSPSTSSIRSATSLDVANYLMKFSVGTPPVQVFVLADTGSDLLWSRCTPCVDCANRQVPVLDPSKSSTYKELPCDSAPCKYYSPNACEQGRTCSYTYAYGGGSSTVGILSTETLTFDTTEGGTTSIDNIVFGCGHNNTLDFDDHLNGLAGLGGSTYSLISQLSPLIKGKFSYCLVPIEESASATSVMNFGDQAVISGPGVVSTPLISKDDKILYYVTLEHIGVGGQQIEVKSPDASNTGNVFLDSGTTVTVLYADTFNQLKEVITSIVKLPTNNDKDRLCFQAKSREGFPAITLHFAGGADLVLQPWNTYNELKDEGLVCLQMVPADGMSILGNIAQQNFHVAYDLEGKTVSFQPAQCSKLSR